MEEYYKIAPDHITGQLYEHIIAAKLSSTKLAEHKIPVLDYDIFGYTWDYSIRIYYLSGGISKQAITLDDTAQAIREIECEYRRQIRVNDYEILLENLQALDKIPWLPEKDFDTSPKFKPESKSSGNSPSLVHGKNPERNFETQKIKYSFSSARDEMRPIMLYLLYAVVRGVDAILSQKYQFFDDGADYADLEDKTELTETYIFAKNELSQETLISEIKESIATLVSWGLYKKLEEYLTKHTSDQLFFTPDELYRYSGYYVGDKGWKRLATKEKIEDLANQLSISAVPYDTC